MVHSYPEPHPEEKPATESKPIRKLWFEFESSCSIDSKIVQNNICRMDWDMNQELFSEEQSEYTEYEDGNSNDNVSGSDSGNGNGNFDYEFDDDDDNDDDDHDEDDENKNETVTTLGAIQKSSDTLDHDDFEVTNPLVSWDDDSGCCNMDLDIGNGRKGDYDGSLTLSASTTTATECNAHGVVHIRLLRARNLPCPVGSSVGATISLPPYKGKVKSTRTKAFLGTSFDHGVCAMWGRERKQPNNKYNYNDDDDDDSVFDDGEDLENENDDDDDDNLLSMVNAWNGPNSPVPSIKIDLTFSPLGLGIFDFTMASIELSSAVLLNRARVWRTRWCPMKLSSSSSNDHHNDDPYVRIQALFVPSISSEYPTVAKQRTPQSSNVTTKPQQSVVVPPPPPLPPPMGKTLIIENENYIKNSSGDPNDTQLVLRSNDFVKTTGENVNDNREETIINRQNDEFIIQPSTNDFWDPQELSLNEDATSLNEDISTVASRRTTASQKATRAAAALRSPHLLRAQTYWAPAKCAVCSKLLMGIFRNGSGFRCEVCSIDCCGDCRLHVDLRVPCGSDLASDIVEASFRNKMSASGLLSLMAPDVAYEEKREASKHPLGNTNSVSSIISSKQSLSMTTYASPIPIAGTESSTLEGIGRCRFEISTACLFLQSTKTWNDSSGENEKLLLRKGDYYVRVSMSGSDRSARTPTLQKTGGMPNFRSAEMRFSISHYGVEFRIDVVEADTDTIVGSTFLTTQGILQEQRDAYIAENGASLLQVLKGPIPWMASRIVKLKLRSGIKTGASADEYYSFPPKGSGNSSKGSSGEQKGSISGWVEMSVGIKEFYSRLYGPNPVECPNRPPADLNLANFSNYIGRLKGMIDELNHAIAQYQYIVSWKNPLWTATSLYIFIWLCLQFDAEYIGCLPIFLAIAFLVYCAYQRNQGGMKSRFIRRAIETMQKVEGNSVGCKIYRPWGTISIATSKGRNLLSQELGIAGNTSCKVIWDPLRLADGKAKERIARSDISADTPFEMGSTPTIYTSDPDWDGMVESAVVKRLNQLLPSAENDFFETSSESNDGIDIYELSFPILQPVRSTDIEKDEVKLEAWEFSQGAIVLQVKFQDFFNNLPGFDHVLGEVVIPFGELMMEREIKGWFQILDVGTTSNVRLEDHEVDGGDLFCGTSLDLPRIYVNLKWDPSIISAVDDPDDGQREMSNAIQEELVRSSIIFKESKINLVDSSIGAVSKAFGFGGTVQVVQNTLGSIIDFIEGLINILNFTDPYKSSTIFIGLLPVWLILCLIPTRYIVLLAGLAQYGITFVDMYGKDLGLKSRKQSKNKEGPEVKENGGKSNPFTIKITNAIRSIPTNEDLRKTYFWESRQLGTETAKKYALEKRESRLKKLWKAKWHSSIKILFQDDETDQRKQPTFNLKPIFAVVQGHRFIWWDSVDEFDDGELPSGKVILSGHAGLGGPSPIEIRKLDRERELPLCLTIFGRGSHGQERVTILLPDKTAKQDLENVIIHSASFKSD